jgi:hypothetical protein
MQNNDVKLKEIANIYRSLMQTAEKIDENIYKNIENSLKGIEKIINIDLKDMISDKLKLKGQTETTFQNILQNFNKLYENSLNNVKACEVKINDEIKKLAAAKPVQPAVIETVQQPLQQDIVKTIQKPTGFIKAGILPHALVKYSELGSHLKSTQAEFDSIFSTSQFKSYKYELQNAINFSLNSLLEDESNVDNKRNFHDKIKTIIRLLNGETCVITSILTVNPKKHPKGNKDKRSSDLSNLSF